MTTKLKIDLSLGILEVEGSESFVRAIYEEFKAQFLGEQAADDKTKPTRRRRTTSTRKKSKVEPKPSEAQVATTPTKTTPVVESPPKRHKPAPAPTYTYVKDLELGSTPDHPSLVEFMDSKLPITNEELNLVFLYYLQHTIKHKSITADDVYTCYRKANIRAPINLENSLQLTAKQRDWINIGDNGHMSVTAAGKRYVENQLPKKKVKA